MKLLEGGSSIGLKASRWMDLSKVLRLRIDVRSSDDMLENGLPRYFDPNVICRDSRLGPIQSTSEVGSHLTLTPVKFNVRTFRRDKGAWLGNLMTTSSTSSSSSSSSSLYSCPNLHTLHLEFYQLATSLVSSGIGAPMRIPS